MPPIACVTGATGFLASELTRQLLQQGWHVQATVRSTPRAKFLYALPHAASRLKLFEADLLAPHSFDECVKDADHVFHTASPFITSNITDPDLELHRPALEGTKSIFSAIVKAGIKPRIVLTSSVAAVMGKATDKPADQCFDEDDWNSTSEPHGNPPGDGLDIYRYSKLIAEREAWRLAEKHGLEMASICPTFIVGPPVTNRVDGESLRNMKQALEGEMPHRPDTPMIDVRDCAAAHIAAATVDGAVGQRFITSTPRAVARSQVLQWLTEAYPQYRIHPADFGQSKGPSRKLFCEKNLHILGLSWREPKESLLDMAAAMLDHGVVEPKRSDRKAKGEL